jgi:hypothetical protein
MDLSRIVKWLVILVLLFVVWMYVIPWAKEEMGGSTASKVISSSGGGDQNCVDSAARASEAWGSGLARYVNPPYDLDAWSNFKRDIDSQIRTAEADCRCTQESCQKVRDAMSELRNLAGDLDTALRSGGSPGQDIVQRQEIIDRRIDEARDLVKAGK